jgi:hypothetical protein
MYLAMRSQHANQTVRLSDGQRIQVQRGQWLTSARKLRHELGKGSFTSITADLAVLKAAGAIQLHPIPRYQSSNGGVTEPVTGGVLKPVAGDSVMATLITVQGLALTADPVTKPGTKEEERKASPVSRKERLEWEHANAILSAEGR